VKNQREGLFRKAIKQQRYSITELELFSILETLKEFRGMLWGLEIKIYKKYQNLDNKKDPEIVFRAYRL